MFLLQFSLCKLIDDSFTVTELSTIKESYTHIHSCNFKYTSYIIWHEKLTVIKFYGLSTLCKLKNFMDYNFTEAHVIEARYNTCARAENGIDHQ